MTLIERKQHLIQRLQTVFDEHLINEIEQLLDQKEQKNDILLLFRNTPSFIITAMN